MIKHKVNLKVCYFVVPVCIPFSVKLLGGFRPISVPMAAFFGTVGPINHYSITL